MVDVPRLLLGIACGTLVAAPVASGARRAHVVTRCIASMRHVTDAPAPNRAAVGARAIARRVATATGPVNRVVGAVVARRRATTVTRSIERELPVALDLLGVAVGAGCTPFLALDVASRWSPPVIAQSFKSVLRACALGARLEAALDDLARVSPRIAPVTDALLASERLGAPVGPALARLAAEERANVRRRAEAHARRVPVRLLFPLVFLVLPAFVLLTVVPGLAASLARL